MTFNKSHLEKTLYNVGKNKWLNFWYVHLCTFTLNTGCKSLIGHLLLKYGVMIFDQSVFTNSESPFSKPVLLPLQMSYLSAKTFH